MFHALPRWGGGRFLFAVPVDPSFPGSDVGRAVLRRYRARVWAHAGLATLMVAVLHRWGPGWAVIGLLWLAVNAQLAFVKAQAGVRPHGLSSSLRTASLAPSRPGLPGRWVGQAGPFLILAGVAGAIWRARVSIDALQAHATRTFRPPPLGGALAFVLGASVFCGLFLALASGLRALARHPSEAGRRSTLLTLLAAEYLVALVCVAIFVPLTVARSEADMRIVPVLLVGVVLTFLAVLAYLTSVAATAGPSDGGRPDRWKWGLFYNNPEDAAVFVPKRAGIGYTLNFAQPWAWVVSGAMLLVVLASLLAPAILGR
jgi:hypothetical protein